MTSVSSFLPTSSIQKDRKTNETVIEMLGDATIRAVVKSILEGGNLRDLTEDITRKRILSGNIALLLLYFKMKSAYPQLAKQLTSQVSYELAKSKDQNVRDFLLPFIGMTRKGWDNIVRGDKGKQAYCERLDENLREIEDEVIREYGSIHATLSVDGKEAMFSTADLLRCLLAVGSQTLAIRGSEKSIYGKLFERLILGSVLTLLGFKKIEKNNCEESNMVFWLSDPKNKRECDATAIVAPGICVRFDIGFIGRGNPEISLDKVTRYENQMSMPTKTGMQTYYSHTIIIVDTLGPSSKTQTLARQIGGDVIQMNGSFWVKELSEIIGRASKSCYRSPLSRITNEQSLEFIESRIGAVDLNQFLSTSIQHRGLQRNTIGSREVLRRPFLRAADSLDGDNPVALTATDEDDSY